MPVRRFTARLEDLQGNLIMLNRLVSPTLLRKRFSQALMRFRQFRVGADSVLVMINRLIQLPSRLQNPSHVVARSGKIRVELQRLFKLLSRLVKVALLGKDRTQRKMCLA